MRNTPWLQIIGPDYIAKAFNASSNAGTAQGTHADDAGVGSHC
jgi:GH35 family endo-1,4-beta-xylanase